jgi:amino acid transporter
MDLENLKKAWEKLPTEKQLDEEQLSKMLGKHTKSLIDRIDRNIKIGLMVLFVLILIFALDDFLLSPMMLESINENITVPGWLLFLSVFSNALILTTFIYFVIKYYKVKKACDTVCDLKETLKKIIGTLEIYQTMFYLALVTLLVTIGLGFITGMYTGFSDKVKQLGIPISEVNTEGLIAGILIGLVILVILVGGVFLFLRWGFRKLYGNYIHELKLTLKELEEINE